MSWRISSYFSGIGGLELGLERAGLGAVVSQCELDVYCRQVLARHWPGVPIFEDIREVSEPPEAEVICGGFPCQDLSIAGAGAGLDGERSGLFFELLRIVGLVRPRLVVLENVPALTFRGLGRCLGELAQIGYDARWRCLSVAQCGGPQLRERIWIVAYPSRQRRQALLGQPLRSAPRQPRSTRCRSSNRAVSGWDRRRHPSELDRASARVPRWLDRVTDRRLRARLQRYPWRREQWEGDTPRTKAGVPHRAKRIRALGNAVSPIVAKRIGRWALQIVGEEGLR